MRGLKEMILGEVCVRRVLVVVSYLLFFFVGGRGSLK